MTLNLHNPLLDALPLAERKNGQQKMLTKVELLKQQKPPLSLLDDIYRWAQEGFDAIPPEYYDLFKWHGLFYRKQTPGFFMLRMRISNGILSSTQLRAIAELSRRVGRGVGDFTTRQNIQLRWITIENAPLVIERLQEVGLGSQQTGMDNFRNVTGCAVTGVNVDELIETRQLTIATALSMLGHEFENLPRKFNISINGCRHDCTEAQTNDLGLTPAIKRTGGRDVLGFNVVVGGHMGGTSPHFAQPFDVFVRPMQVTAFCRAVLRVFRDNGNREKRTKARLHWLIEEWGMDRFHDAVMHEFGERLPTAGASQLYAAPDPLVKDHIGIHRQKQPGLNYVGLVVPVGRFTSDQLFDLADLTDRYGAHELRLTNDQNVIIPNVPDAKVPALLNEPLLQDWSPTPSGIMRGLVTCTGKDHCHFALNDTKGIALEIAQRLEQRFPDKDKAIRLNVSGCVHSCGRHQATELGLEATRIRIDGEVVDGFHLYGGGCVGENPQLGQITTENATIEQTVELLAAQIAEKYGYTT